MTDGKEERQLIYIDDCIRNLLLIRELNGKMFHLTNNEWIPVVKIAEKVANMFNAKIKLGEHSGYQCKVEPNKTHKLFKFEVNIDQGIEKIVKRARSYLTNIK
jgi:nucleoside-diphosphate-sugar epimerase